MSSPEIPYGYKPVPAGESTQKGDGKWDGERFRKVKREYPRVRPDEVVIRKQEVTQPVLPETEDALSCKTITVHWANGVSRLLNRVEYEAIKATGSLWEFHPDAPQDWPDTVEICTDEEPA